MTAPISPTHVDISFNLTGASLVPSNRSVPALIHENALGGARLQGPFTQASDVVDFGHASGSPPHLWAQALTSQTPRCGQFYIAKRLAGDADNAEAAAAANAENTGAVYCWQEETRDANEILALAGWVESNGKLGLTQASDASLLVTTGSVWTAIVGGTPTDGNYDLIFTGFGLTSPVTVTTTRAGGTPTDNDALATQIDVDVEGTAALDDIVADIEVTGSNVAITLNENLANGTITSSAPAPGTLVVTRGDADVGSLLRAANYSRTALVYHAVDTEFLDGAWAGRCLAFDLDQAKDTWAYKHLNGITASNLTSVEAAALRGQNVNYFSNHVTSSGNSIQAFTAQGWTSAGDPSAGRPIDITTTIDHATARYEESILGVLLNGNMAGFDNAGINRFRTAISRTNTALVNSGHYIPFVVPDGETNAGELTPLITVPSLASTSSAQRSARSVSIQNLVYLRNGIERVVFAVEGRQ